MGGDMPSQYDMFAHGTVFFDVVFTGLDGLPARGTEIQATGMGSCPGGIANLAIAASRLGVHTSLAAAFGDDVYGDFCWSTLTEQEGVDLSCSRRFPGWHSPVTISMVLDRDRALLTHAHPAPAPSSELLTEVPAARIGFAHLDAEPRDWFQAAASSGMLLFADTGWDQNEEWPPSVLDQLKSFHAFLPNSIEAMAYTHTDDPHDALHALAELIPVAVVTCGGQGAIAIDGTTGEQEWVPSLPVNAQDPTGAGDVFGAAFVLGTCAAGRCGSGWPSPTCAPPCPSSTSAGRWPRPGGETSSTGWPASGSRPPRAPATPPNWLAPMGSSRKCCPNPGGSRSAAPARPSPAPPTPNLIAPGMAPRSGCQWCRMSRRCRTGHRRPNRDGSPESSARRCSIRVT